jgi:hypothetical protein
MDPSIKSLTITGSAAEDATRSRLKSTGSRRKRVAVKDQEDEFIEQAKNFTLQKDSIEQKPVILQPKVIEPKILQPRVLEPRVLEPRVLEQTHIKHTNVILNPPKQSRVKLQPKILSSVKQVEQHATRKARRIKLNVSNLTHRFTRAKKVKDETEKKSMDTVREYLVQKGVIQAKSKAPEKMLRSMYADFMLLKDQAL